MSRKKRLVEALTDTEQCTLEQGFKYGPAPDFRQRCQILLLSHKGYEVKQIINMLDVSPHTVYSTMKSWREDCQWPDQEKGARQESYFAGR
ncbi:helix-turn-helix domain-containing protein [Catalinimonas sp. 4WD22]|uniref:helix-turn-helix domain-containing protein n=1 Tax=Catalinimonas locisalis TaxID=3133978 RepID=UPI00310137BB